MTDTEDFTTTDYMVITGGVCLVLGLGIGMFASPILFTEAFYPKTVGIDTAVPNDLVKEEFQKGTITFGGEGKNPQLVCEVKAG